MLEVQEQTGITPRGLQHRPTLRADCCDYHKAYGLVSRARQQGYGGPQALTLAEMREGLDLMDVSRGRRMVYVEMMQAMDSTFLGYVAKKQEQQK